MHKTAYRKRANLPKRKARWHRAEAEQATGSEKWASTNEALFNSTSMQPPPNQYRDPKFPIKHEPQFYPCVENCYFPTPNAAAEAMCVDAAYSLEGTAGDVLLAKYRDIMPYTCARLENIITRYQDTKIRRIYTKGAENTRMIQKRLTTSSKDKLRALLRSKI